MKRGQPQCVLSVDISTCGDIISSFEGRWKEVGKEAGNQARELGWSCSLAWTKRLDQAPENNRWIRKKRLLPSGPLPRCHTFQLPTFT